MLSKIVSLLFSVITICSCDSSNGTLHMQNDFEVLDNNPDDLKELHALCYGPSLDNDMVFSNGNRIFIDHHKYGGGLSPFPLYILDYWGSLQKESENSNEKGVFCDGKPMINPLRASDLYSEYFKNIYFLLQFSSKDEIEEASIEETAVVEFTKLVRSIFYCKNYSGTL